MEKLTQCVVCMHHRSKDVTSATTMTQRRPVILVLDETLQKLPWECLDILKGHPVSRCPSLEYVEAAIRRYTSKASNIPATCASTAKSKKTGKAKAAEARKLTIAATTVSFREDEVRQRPVHRETRLLSIHSTPTIVFFLYVL